MKTLLNKVLLVMAVVVASSTTLFAQQAVNLRELNTYPYELTTLDSLAKHPLNGVSVKFTAILSSYPRNSGLASYTSSTDAIGRVHLFVVDTTAASLGRDGMAMQVVQPSSAANFGEIEKLNPGVILDITGNLTFFGYVAQFNVTAIEDVTDKVEGEVGDLARFDALLAPVEVNVSDLNSLNEDGTVQINLANYTKYAHAYVKVSDAIVQFTQGAIARPNYVVKNNGTEHLVYSNDISLRYRNDRTSYRTGYNIRTEADGAFTPPPAGAKVNFSGYTAVNNFDAFGRIATGQYIFKMTPMDDGVLNVPLYDENDNFTGYNRNVNGENGFIWPNDLDIIGFPPTFENFATSKESPEPGDVVTISVDVLPAGDGVTLSSVSFEYSVNGTDTTAGTLQVNGSTYSFEFPAFADGDVVTYAFLATDSEGLTGEFKGSFLVASVIKSIVALQKTADSTVANSQFVGLGVLNLDINATVVADANDGLVVVHEAAAPWSGIFLDARIQAVKDLKRGDVINLTAAEVVEDRDGTGVTYLTKVEFTKSSENSNYADLIPSVLTQDVRMYPEAYEGMVIKFADVKIVNLQADGASDFGEFEIGSRQGGAEADTLEAGEGLRIDGSYPSSSTSFGSGVRNFSDSYNENAILGASFDYVIGMVYYSFNNPKLLIRQLEDFAGDNWTKPVRTFSLLNPAANATVNLTGLESYAFEWTSTFDQDGDTVSYVLQLATDSEVLTKIASDSLGLKTKATFTAAEIDAILADQSVETGASLALNWTVFAVSNEDTVQISTYAGIIFTPLTSAVTLQRATVTSNEIDGKTYEFELAQNYPNPFNPSTAIDFSVPTNAKVSLTVYNVLGQQVATLVNQNMNAGRYSATFNASAMSSGVYFYRLEAGSHVAVKKMLLIK